MSTPWLVLVFIVFSESTESLVLHRFNSSDNSSISTNDVVNTTNEGEEDTTDDSVYDIFAETVNSSTLGSNENITKGSGVSSEIDQADKNTDDGPKDTAERPLDDIANLTLWRLSRIFCNFDAFAAKRRGKGRFLTGDTDGSPCTDFNFDSAELADYHFESETHTTLLPHGNSMYLPPYMSLNNLKIAFPNLRTFLTITESESISFSSVVLNSVRRRSFVKSCVFNLRLWGFDGLLIKWLYPEERSLLTRLLLNLRAEFDFHFNRIRDSEKLLLGVMLSGQFGVADRLYQVYAISKLVDVIVLLLFDEAPTHHYTTKIVSSIYSNEVISAALEDVQPTVIQETLASKMDLNESSTNSSSNNISSNTLLQDNKFIVKKFILEETITEWTYLGADKTKMVIGLTLTGHGYILQDASLNGVGAPADGPSFPMASNVAGEIFFYEMCQLVKNGNVKRLSENDKSPYWYNNKLWVSYEDMISLKQKVEYLRDSHVLGVMLFSQSEDDFTGLNCDLGPFPASQLVYNVSRAYLESLFPTGQEEWMSYCSNASRVTVSTFCLFFSTMVYFSYPEMKKTFLTLIFL